VGEDSRGGWDFFVSYAQADQLWAEWIAWTLEEDGYRVLVQAWDFVPGSNWVQGMQAGTTGADRTIAVLSPRYLKSVYGSGEWQAAWASDPHGTKRKLLVLRVEDCDRPGLLAGVVGVDLFGTTEAMAETRLRNMVSAATSGRAKPAKKPGFPGAGRAMPHAIRFPGTYEHAYAEVTQAVLSSLSTVDSVASARTFVSRAANKIREASASVPEFYLGEFFNVFKDAAVAQAGKEIADCQRAIEQAKAEANAATNELQARLEAALNTGDREAEHAVWRERETRQAACQAKIDTTTARMDPIGLRIGAIEDLATALRLSFD
jgi:hypothetical protein